MPRGVQTSRRANDAKRRQLLMRDSDDQVYGVVTAVLGNGRFSVQLYLDPKPETPVLLQCRVRGNMRRREWVNNGDIVLVAKRDFDDGKGDIITRYMLHEIAQLRRYGEIPSAGVDSTNDPDLDDLVVFEHNDDEDLFRNI